MTWSTHSTDSGTHHVSVLVDVDPVIAVNDRSEKVVSFRNETTSLRVLSVGSRDQNVLNRSGDNMRIDWGYFRLAVPKDEPSTLAIAPDPAATFAGSGRLPASDSIGMPDPAAQSPHLAVTLDLGAVDARRFRVTFWSRIRRDTQSSTFSATCVRTGSATT